MTSKDAIEIAIPALARRIDEGGLWNIELWDAIGNVGMTNDEDVFQNVLTLVLSKTGLKNAGIGETLARMPGRPFSLSILYLDMAMSAFMERASTLSVVNSQAILSELLSYATLIKIICEQEQVQFQLLSDSPPEIIVQFRNMWFYMVCFIVDGNGSLPKEWDPVMLVLAASTPFLVSHLSQSSLIADLASNSILAGSFPDAV